MTEKRWRWKQIGRGQFVAVTTCSICGVEVQNGNPTVTLYCADCAAKVKREKGAERARRWRERHKDG